MIWCDFITFFIETYIEFLIGALINLKFPINKSFFDKLSIFSSFNILFIICALLPIVYSYVVFKVLNTSVSLQFDTRYMAFYDGINKKKLTTLLFYAIYFSRRIIYVSLGLFLDSYTFQIIIMQFLNIFMIIYQGKVNPFDTPLMNKVELFNEFCICLSCLTINAYTDWIEDKELQYQYGWM